MHLKIKFLSRFTPYDSPRSNQSLNKNPRSKNQLYDVPQVPKGIKDNQQSQKHLYDIPRTKNKLYDLPKSNKEVNKTRQIHGYHKFIFDSDQAGQEPYDNPSSSSSSHATRGEFRLTICDDVHAKINYNIQI